MRLCLAPLSRIEQLARFDRSSLASTMQPRVIGFDADDTLWHNETLFAQMHDRYRRLLARHHDAATVDRTLFATEVRNLDLYGYGIKGFTLSAIETAIELTDGQIGATEIQALIRQGQEILAHPVDLLDGIVETLGELAATHTLLLITKGDLRDQQRKLAKSGLAARFDAVEIVSEKDEPTYADLLRRHGVAPEEFLMVGNSLKSDILPVIALGAAAAHVPYPLTWQYELATPLPAARGRFFQLAHIRELPALLRSGVAA
jgi:putative hydrolase of the HAD superfamily